MARHLFRPIAISWTPSSTQEDARSRHRDLKEMRVVRCCLVFVAAALCGVSAAQNTIGPTIITPDNVQWTVGSGTLAGAQVAVMSGDPSKGGMYIIRLKLVANQRSLPHYHPSPENVTVISGTLYVGLGPKVNESKMTALPAGAFVSIPAHVIHYAMTKAPAIIQLEGIGPLLRTNVNSGT